MASVTLLSHLFFANLKRDFALHYNVLLTLEHTTVSTKNWVKFPPVYLAFKCLEGMLPLEHRALSLAFSTDGQTAQAYYS